MEFRFKEAKNGYAKAEVDAYIMNLQNFVDDLQLRDISIEKKRMGVNLKVKEIEKGAFERAEKIIENANRANSDINEDAFSSFKSLTMIRYKINRLIQSTIHEIPDIEISSLKQSFTELENEVDLNLKHLKSLMFDLS